MTARARSAVGGCLRIRMSLSLRMLFVVGAERVAPRPHRSTKDVGQRGEVEDAVSRARRAVGLRRLPLRAGAGLEVGREPPLFEDGPREVEPTGLPGVGDVIDAL